MRHNISRLLGVTNHNLLQKVSRFICYATSREILINTTYRSTAPELMDDFSMEGNLLKDALDKIARINQLLGGNKVTIQGVETLLKQQRSGNILHILDAGCGNGDMLRTISDWARRRQMNVLLTGIDANAFTIAHAKRLSAGYTNIRYDCMDIFDQGKTQHYDIILCTLTLHHFKDDQILSLLQLFEKQARLGIVINDLHRSRMAYYLFQLICGIFGLNRMSREDGLVSILRSFKKKDLLELSRKMGLKKYSIKWKWAFRYQWIITTT